MKQLFRNLKSVLFCLLLAGYGPGFAQETLPQKVNFQGRLTDLSDNPLNGAYSLTFSLYTGAEGGTALWTETQPEVSITNGAVEAVLGSVTAIPWSVAKLPGVYLEIQVGSEVLNPRQPFNSVLYAMNAAQLAGKTYDTFIDTYTAQTISGIKIFSANPVFNDDAIPQIKVRGLTTALAAVAADTTTLKGQINAITGDNLGSHTATTTLNMAGYSILSVSTISATNSIVAAYFVGNGAGLAGVPGDNLGNHTAISSLNMANFPINNVSTLSVTNSVSAAKYYGDGSSLTGIAGDNLGSHTATQDLNMGGRDIVSVSTITVSSITAAGFGVTVSTNLLVNGFVWGGTFHGDGSFLTGIAGDNLGSHTATQNLNMGAYGIITSSNITAARYYGNGSGLTGIAGDNLGNHTATMALNMGGYPVSNVISVTVSSNVTAGKYYGDGSNLTGIAGDNLGDHTASSSLNMANFPINNVSTLNVTNSVTAAKYYGDGSSLTGIAGDNLGNHTATMALNMSGYPISNVASVTVSSNVTALKYYGDGSSLTGIAGDNLGNHTASADLNMSGRNIVSVGTVTAAHFVGDGSGLTNISAADNTKVSKASDTMTGSLNFSGVTADITSGQDEHIAIMPTGAGNVGIGELYPYEKLTVNGGIRATGNLTVGYAAGSSTITFGAGAGDSVIYMPDNQGLTIKGTRESYGTAFLVQSYNAAKTAFLDRFAITGTTATANIYTLNSNVGIGTVNPSNQFVLAHGSGVMNKVFLDGTIDDGSGDVKRVISLANTDGSNYGGYLALGNKNSPLTGPADGATVLLSGAPNQNSYISVGNVGIGTVSPGAKLEVAGEIKITGGTPGAGKVLTSDSAGLASWQAASGDNLGNHIATTTLNMAGFALNGVSTITMLNGSIAIVPPGTGGLNAPYGISIGSGAYNNYDSGVGVGVNAYNNYTYGVGVGAGASDNYNFGVGVGDGAFGNYDYGVGVGDGAYSNDDHGVGVGNAATGNRVYGVGVGALAYNNYTYGVGVGRSASNNSDYGVGMGAFASFNDAFAVGIGAYSQNNQGYGSALGAYSYAFSSSTALGSYAKANAEKSIAIGYGTVNNSTGTASFGSYAVYTSSSVTAAKYFGDGSALTGITGDNLGNHIATTTLQMGAYSINSSGNITAGRYQIAGSTVLAILPGTGSLGIGVDAGYSNTTGESNSFMGYQAGYLNTSGGYNSFMGYRAGYSNTTGSYNSFVGHAAGLNNTTGGNNSFVGRRAGNSNTTGGSNSFLGNQAGYYNETGSANAILGEAAGWGIYGNSFSSSTIVGYQAGYLLTTGSDNIFLGFQAGLSLTTGNRNIIIGYDQDAPTAATSNHLNIGGAIYGDLSSVKIGIGTAAPASRLTVMDGDIRISSTTGTWGIIFQDGSFQTTAANPGVSKTGDTMTGQLTLANSTLTVTGSEFSVAGSTFVVKNGNVGIGNSSPGNPLSILNPGNLGVIFKTNDPSKFSELNLANGNYIWGIGNNIRGDNALHLEWYNGSTAWASHVVFASNGNVGLSTGTPQARLDVLAGGSAQTDMAQIWRNSAGTIVSSVSATGVMTASKFVGDGSGLTGVSGGSLSIGASYGGGKIGWLDSSGNHGIIVSTTDNSPGIVYSTDSSRVFGASFNAVYAGKMNTAIVTANQGAENYAAKLCEDYFAVISNEYYDDWYLPSEYELSVLYPQKALLGFISNLYWSSKEQDVGYSRVVDFTTGTASDAAKNTSHYVRCVRSF